MGLFHCHSSVSQGGLPRVCIHTSVTPPAVGGRGEGGICPVGSEEATLSHERLFVGSGSGPHAGRILIPSSQSPY